MKIRYLDGTRLYHAFLAGGRAVIRDRQYLNKINVFPVPDADTGTNLAATMQAIAGRARAFASAHRTLGSIADAALAGARGNSGLIFAGFLYGLSQEARSESRLTTRHFAESVRRAVQYARRSIVTPVEGTMITLLHDWAEALYEKRLKLNDFSELLHYAYEAAQRSLRETPRRLPVLAQAGVVDAGAKGFVDFLEGVMNLIKKGDLRSVRAEAAAVPAVEPDDLNARTSVTRRFCTEATLVGGRIDADALRAVVAAAGESGVVAGSRSKVRFHVHTDDPAELFARLQALGSVAEVKVDDMLRQYEAAHSRKSSVALLTDSACDLPAEVFDDHQIHIVPFTLSFGESVFLDKLTITPERFYEMLKSRREMPRSAQPAASTITRLTDFLTSHYEKILIVAISDKLTGFHRQALAVRDSLGPDRVSVIDSRHISASQGLIVLRAAEAIRSGMAAEDIAASARDWIAKTRLWVDIKTLKYMVRGGRVSPLKGLAAGLLNIKPIIALDDEGRPVALGKSFSRRGNMKKILDLIGREAAGRRVWKYAVVHAQNRFRALRYGAELAPVLGQEPAFIMDISPVIGVHNGIGVVGICLMFE